MEAVTCNLFLLLTHSSSVLGTPSQMSSALITTTTSSGISLMPTKATSHPLQKGTSSAAVSSTPPGFYGHDLSFSSSGMGGNYPQAVGMGGQPTGVRTTHYSQPMGIGGPLFGRGRGIPCYSRASWGDTSGRGMNNAHAAAKSGQPGWGGEQYHGLVGAQHSHSAMGGGSQHDGARMYYSQLVAGTAQGANDGMQYVLGDGSNVVTSQPGSQDWSSKETGTEGHLSANSGVFFMYATVFVLKLSTLYSIID